MIILNTSLLLRRICGGSRDCNSFQINPNFVSVWSSTLTVNDLCLSAVISIQAFLVSIDRSFLAGDVKPKQAKVLVLWPLG